MFLFPEGLTLPGKGNTLQKEKPPYRRWTEAEDKIIRGNRLASDPELLKLLAEAGYHRSEHALRRRRAGMPGRPVPAEPGEGSPTPQARGPWLLVWTVYEDREYVVLHNEDAPLPVAWSGPRNCPEIAEGAPFEPILLGDRESVALVVAPDQVLPWLRRLQTSGLQKEEVFSRSQEVPDLWLVLPSASRLAVRVAGPEAIEQYRIHWTSWHGR